MGTNLPVATRAPPISIINRFQTDETNNLLLLT